MKKLLLFSSILAFSIFTNCKKKTVDPVPASTTTTTANTTTNTSQFGKTSGISSNGTITPLTTKAYYQGSIYMIEGVDAGVTFTIDASFPNGQPTKSSTEDLAKSTFSLYYSTSSYGLVANSGTANIVVSDTAITVTFTDAVFTNKTTTIKYSGQLIISTKTTTGGSGTATVSGTTSNLMIISSTSSSTGAYSITGMIAGTQNSVMLLFTNGKPTTNSTEDLSSSSKINIAYNTSSTQYLSKAGTATISLNSSGDVTVTFTNATLYDTNNSNSTLAMSANITATK
jgi:hypothetical protein